MAADLSIEERYIQHQRGLFVPKHVPVAYVPAVMTAAAMPRGPYQVRAPERPDQSLHVVVQSLQKQVNELQTLVRSLQHQVPDSGSVPTEPLAKSKAPLAAVARTPSEEELLRRHREHRAPESKPWEESWKAPAAVPEPPVAPVVPVVPVVPAAPASLLPSGQRELSEQRRQVKRSWIQGLSKGPSLWQILQQRLCLKEDKKNEERQSTRRPVTSPDVEVKNQSLEELCTFICSDLVHRYGCLEVAAAFAALSMQMCSEQEIDSFLASVEDGERGLRVAPLAAASALPAIAFGAQGFEDALIDVLQVRVSRKNARRLFRQLASRPCSQRAAIGSVGTTAQLTQLLGAPSGDESHESGAISPPRQTSQTAQTARSQPEKGLTRSQSEGRTRPKTTRLEVGVAKRPSLGVHLQEQMRQHWQGGLREKREEKLDKASLPREIREIREIREKSESPDTSKLSSRRSSLKTPPPQPSNSTASLPPAANRRSYEVWRRDVSLKSLLAFEAEVKARQESSTTSSDDGADAREVRSSKLPSSDSPPSSLRLRRSSEEERLEALPARLAEAMEAERRGT